MKISSAILLAIKKGIKFKRGGARWFYTKTCGCIVGAASLAVMPEKDKADAVKHSGGGRWCNAGEFFPVTAIYKAQTLFEDKLLTPRQCATKLKALGF